MIRFLVWLFGIQSAVAGIVVSKDGKILLTKRSSMLIEGGKWSLSGGGMKKWEKSDNAMIRELKEETGLDVKKINFLFVHEEFVKRLKIHANVFVFEIKPFGKVNPNWEVSGYKWFSKDEIDKIGLAFNHKEIIHKYFKMKRR